MSYRREEPTVLWTVNSKRSQVNVPTEGKSLMAVGGLLFVAGVFVWAATGK